MSKELLDLAVERLAELEESRKQDLYNYVGKEAQDHLNNKIARYKAAIEAEKPKPQRYRIMSHGFGRDSNGNPTSRFRIFKIIDSVDGGNMDIQIHYNDRRSQCGYNDNRSQHAFYWLGNNTDAKNFKILSVSGSRDEDCITVLCEEEV
jgi:hypothetical protein